MKLNVVFAAILLLAPAWTSAEIEKVAIPGSKELKLLWWPKASLPPGWHSDRGSSEFFGFNAMAPDGSTFSKAETVMYAKADFKPRVPKFKNLASLISHDIADFEGAVPGTVAKKLADLHDGDGKPFQVVSFTPGKDGNWERVAYGEEGEFYLVFTLSSRSKAGHDASIAAFTKLVAGYRERP